MRTQCKLLISLLLFLPLITVGLSFAADVELRPEVLVVMSYHESYPWCREIKVEIDRILSGSYQIHYFYLNTKNEYEQGEHKAREAFDLFQQIKPAGVIAVDDNAQSMFVVPYLKDKVKTPVMFCGVNDIPEKYGYPATNVSGILERSHIAETIAYAQQLVPTLKTVCFMGKNSPSIWAIREIVLAEHDNYSAEFIDFKMPITKGDVLSMVEELKPSCDMLFMETMGGIIDSDGRPMGEREATSLVAATFAKPLIGSNLYSIRHGALCAVVKTGQEQGVTAARMLLRAMQETPLDQIPIEVNKYGKRYINVTVMKRMGIKIKPILLQGAELIRTED